MTIDYVVVLHDIFARIKVKPFNAFLGSLKGFGDALILDWRILVYTKSIHKHGDAVALENTHEVVFATDEKLGCARIALTSTAST